MFITRHGKVNFVDLAGSEMTKKTKSEGKTLMEANNINKSLMVLGELFILIQQTAENNRFFFRLLHLTIEQSEENSQLSHSIQRQQTD